MVNIHAAKTQLSSLLGKVESGEEVIIARAGKPVARLVSVSAPQVRKLGALKGQLEINEGFDAPVNPETWGL